MRTTTKRALALTLAWILCFLTGCEGPVKVRRLEAAKVKHPEKESIVGVTTVKGEDVLFDRGGTYVQEKVIHAQVKQAPRLVPLADVQRLWIEKRGRSTVATVGLAAGVVALGLVVIAVIAVAVKGSCPFVYSWDGSKYVFDAEPYGGAITRGLERDDYAELPHLRAQDGVYRLMLTNEVDETQMTNLTELWVIDHPAGVRMSADEFGKLYTLSETHPPISARDAQGRDLLPWLCKRDRLIWEPAAEPDATGNLRQDIILTFPKPEGATLAKLEADAATSLWASYMIKQMVQLRGRDAREWYRQIDESAAARDELFAWNLREELFMLKVYVEEPSGWVARGMLPGGGPVLVPNRVVPLDVSHVRGPRLRIRIQPPLGCWALNSFAVDYSPERPFHITRVAPVSARDYRGRSVLSELLATDDRYYAMPTTADRAFVTFPAPPERAGTARTVFLHSRGYYRLHLPETHTPDTVTLTRLKDAPGAGPQFAAEQYKRWKTAAR